MIVCACKYRILLTTGCAVHRATAVCVRRYSKRSNNQISFDDFIACAVRVRAYSAAFRQRDTAGQGFAQLQYDDFMQIVMRL